MRSPFTNKLRLLRLDNLRMYWNRFCPIHFECARPGLQPQRNWNFMWGGRSRRRNYILCTSVTRVWILTVGHRPLTLPVQSRSSNFAINTSTAFESVNFEQASLPVWIICEVSAFKLFRPGKEEMLLKNSPRFLIISAGLFFVAPFVTPERLLQL